jgi:starch-binding outer membrane protein, SusD/RagB family
MRTICFLLAFILFFSNACNFLEEPQPTDTLPNGEAFRTAADLEDALTGAYDAVQNGHTLGRNFIVFPDLMGGNASYFGGGWFGLPEIGNLQITTTSWYVENLWMQTYLAINQLNQILAALPVVDQNDPALTNEEYDRIQGEAAFLRGVLYFELVRLFALPYEPQFLDSLGVPLMLKPVLKKENLQFPARAAVGEVYDQIITDLDLAIEKSGAASPRGRANLYAALAYRARVAFQQNNYLLVEQLTRDLVENSPFSLTDTPAKFFREKGTSEVIWSLLNEPGDEIGGGNLYSMFADARIRDGLRKEGFEMIVTQSQFEKVQAAGYAVVDLRADPGILSNAPFISPDSVFILKYTDYSETPVARWAEFVIMRAEALARLDDTEGAVTLLNQIRERSLRIVDENGYEVPEAAKDFVVYKAGDVTKAELIEAIIRERRVELAFEGNYFHDLMRLKRDVQDNPYDADKLRLPIPQREMDVNPALIQNPGY